jgi:hypothetical protein
MIAQFNEQGGLLIDLFEALVPNVTRGDGQEAATENFAYVGDEAEAIACHASSAASMSSAVSGWLDGFALLPLGYDPHVLWRAGHFDGDR